MEKTRELYEKVWKELKELPNTKTKEAFFGCDMSVHTIHETDVSIFLHKKFKPKPPKTEIPKDYSGWLLDTEDSRWLGYFINGVLQYHFSQGKWYVKDDVWNFSVSDLDGTEIIPSTSKVYNRLENYAESIGLTGDVEVEGESRTFIANPQSIISCVDFGEFYILNSDYIMTRLLNKNGEWAKPIEKQNEDNVFKLDKDISGEEIDFKGRGHYIAGTQNTMAFRVDDKTKQEFGLIYGSKGQVEIYFNTIEGEFKMSTENFLKNAKHTPIKDKSKTFTDWLK